MSEEESVSPMFETEKSALLGDRYAVSQVVSAVRRYRAAVQALLDARYRDGFVDGSATSELADERDSIEREHGEDAP